MRRVVLACIVATSFLQDALAGQLQEIEHFGDNPGNLQMFVHLPGDLPRGAPLVVVVHGCLQSAQDVADNAGWTPLAEQHGFALLFPQTSKENEATFGCFRTWEPEHQRRGEGEPRSIEEMISWLIDNEWIDERRVFITGMSSGGLVTGEMLAAYPEVFAAGALQSAYPYRCANSYGELATCAAGEQAPVADGWGELVLEARPDFDGRRPVVSIWHGEADAIIRPVNLERQLQQWSEALGIDSEPDESETIGGHSRKRYSDTEGVVRIETWEIQGLAHAYAVDPDGTPGCGAATGYFADADICASLWIARWFGIVR